MNDGSPIPEKHLCGKHFISFRVTEGCFVCKIVEHATKAVTVIQPTRWPEGAEL